MRFFGILLAIGLLACVGEAWSQDVSGTFKFKKGGDVTGRVGSVNGSGIVFKKPEGGMTRRYGFRDFDDASLKELIKHPKVRQYAGMLIQMEDAGGASSVALPPPPKLEPLDPPAVGEVEDRPDLPEPRGVFGAIFGTGAGWIMILLVWAGNLWASYHIGIYRRWNKWMVPGIAAAAPVITPIVFISMKPKKVEKKGGAVEEEEEAKPAKKKGAAIAKKPVAKAKVVTARAAGGAGAAAAGAAAGAGAARAAAPAQQPAPMAAPAQPGAAAPQALEAVAYVKGEVNINKRFIETKFAPFFKLVPDEPYRSAWLCFITTRGEFWAKRIPKISQTDITIQCPQEGGGTTDQVCQIADVKEIHLRPPE